MNLFANMVVAIITGKLAELLGPSRDRGDQNVSNAFWIGITLAIALAIAAVLWNVVNGLIAQIHT